MNQTGVEGGIELIEREQAHVACLDLRVVTILGFVLSSGCVGHVGNHDSLGSVNEPMLSNGKTPYKTAQSALLR